MRMDGVGIIVLAIMGFLILLGVMAKLFHAALSAVFGLCVLGLAIFGVMQLF